jgi:hypothetical protein
MAKGLGARPLKFLGAELWRGQAMQNRQYKRGGLSGARLGDTNDIAACHHLWDNGSLNWGGVGIALRIDRAQNGIGQAEVSKSFQSVLSKRQQRESALKQIPGMVVSEATGGKGREGR